MDPCAVVDSRNDVHLVWKDSQPGNREIFYKKCSDGVWDTNALNLSGTGEASDTPTIGVGADDKLTVAWAEKTDGIHYDVLVREYSSLDDVWSPPTNISNNSAPRLKLLQTSKFRVQNPVVVVIDTT